MPCQPLGHATFHRHHIHVGVAFVLGAESDESTIGRERRVRLDAMIRCEGPDVRAVDGRDPKVIRINERDLASVGGRLMQQASIAHADLGRWQSGRDSCENAAENGKSAHGIPHKK